MKNSVTVKVIIGSFLLMSTLGIFAGVPSHVEKTAKENVRKEIIRQIGCPDFVTENTEANDVRAIVSVDESGSVTLYEINAANEELKDYVEKTLKEMKIKNSPATEKFVLVVKFRIA
jgi:hypothetical protein